MDNYFYKNLSDAGIHQEAVSQADALAILTSPNVELLALLQSAFQVRKEHLGQDVTVHIINNAQNGFCPEDCKYCVQAKTSKAGIEEYPLKSDDEILAEAKQAYDSGAFRYCMVFAGRGPSDQRVDHLAQLIKKIKAEYPLEICVSPGLLDEAKAKVLKDAGLDRLNHNLNTSEAHYPKICSTHTFEDRVATLKAAQKVGLDLCSGIIIGMGETAEDILEVAYRLRKFKAKSIPVNFFIPVDGNQLSDETALTPQFCLRTLCLFRFLNPTAEIRVAAGRELHLRSMEVMALYPANSLFMDGYLNVKGAERWRTLQMIKDAGFTVKSEHNLDELLAQELNAPAAVSSIRNPKQLKNLPDLRPFVQAQ